MSLLHAVLQMSLAVHVLRMSSDSVTNHIRVLTASVMNWSLDSVMNTHEFIQWSLHGFIRHRSCCELYIHA